SLERDRVNNPGRDSGQRMAHRSWLSAGLAVLAGLEIGSVHRDHGGHFGAAVTLQQLTPEFFAESRGYRVAQFLGAYQHKPQAVELLGSALAGVGRAESGSGKKQRGV